MASYVPPCPDSFRGPKCLRDGRCGRCKKNALCVRCVAKALVHMACMVDSRCHKDDRKLGIVSVGREATTSTSRTPQPCRTSYCTFGAFCSKYESYILSVKGLKIAFFGACAFIKGSKMLRLIGFYCARITAKEQFLLLLVEKILK